MNTKRFKNKNRPNKPPNPNPSQKTETLITPVEVDEQRADETKDCLLKCDERVPEIVSEIITPPVVETKEPESETPKKPKRNRGKIKQNDKDDEINNSEEGKVPASAIEEPKSIENLESVLSDITPTARKKKNKKKVNENIVEPVLEQQKHDIESKDISPKINKTIKAQSPIPEIKENVVEPKIETTDQEIKQSKKKNKKKKRHDSERSDKAEEALACTAAFQKLINVNDENVDEKKSDVKSIIDDCREDKEIKMATTDILTPEKTATEVEMALEDESLKPKDNPQDDRKIKKRNKKEKKHPPKIEGENFESDTLPESHAQAVKPFIMSSIIDTANENIITNLITEIKEPILESSVGHQCPKTKAKIAKPVEKKSKGKHEKSYDSSELEMKKTETPLTTKENTESEFMQLKIEQKTNENTSKTLIPEAPSKEKRDMKSKSPELKVIPDEKDMHKQESTDIKKCDQVIDLSPSVTLKRNTEMSTDQVIIQTDITTTLGLSDKKEVYSNDFKKINPDTENEECATTIAKGANNPDKSEKETSAVKTDILFDLPPLNAMELELSTCETVPDVQYPRSTSQQHLDDNNNMVIEEMIVVEDVKLDSPVIAPNIPLIQGSGETPISTPQMTASGIGVTEIDPNLPEVKEEKTYLKSKMMEVNQDMEELRLSIERSLAGFTALEKCDEIPEKKIEEKENRPSETESEVNASKVKETMIETNKTYSSSAGIAQIKSEFTETENNTIEIVSPPEEHVMKPPTPVPTESPTPICPARREQKGKGKSKKKGKHEAVPVSTPVQSSSSTADNKDAQKESKKEEKTDQKTETTQEKGKQQSDTVQNESYETTIETVDFEPIDNFEDALTSSVDDVNTTFEIIANEVNQPEQKQSAPHRNLINPEINIIAPVEDTETVQKQQKEHPVSQPKNLLGRTDIPVQSNRTDYKKEKNKTPNSQQAKVKIKDSVEIETSKQSRESQTDNRKVKSLNESFSQMINDNEEYVYKYSFRKVFLQSACHVCKKELTKVRVPCNYCNLIFYCSNKHKDEDWTNHQALCFAVSTIVHLKDEKYIYGDAKKVTGHDYRLIRMQMILSCEKVVKRRLVPWEQEALLYPRVCAAAGCREWRQSKLKDCEGCGQISFCPAYPEHFPKSHQRWCKSYGLYQKLVTYQQTKGRLEPKLPSKVMAYKYVILEKINEVLASLYEEKIDMNDIQYAALTQLATAPLTAAYCHQIYRNMIDSPAIGACKKSSFTIHVVNAELQFEADALNKWEVFFLHLRPEIKELKVVLIGADLNPSNLPLHLLGKIKLCDKCQNKRKVTFSFQDKITYFEYRCSDDYINPDLICAFNPSIYRSSVYNGKDPWPSAINSILKLKSPFIITSYTMSEMNRDLLRIKECTPIPYNVVFEPKYNNFASVRPDRNFISDDEIPLLFKNYCYSIVCGV